MMRFVAALLTVFVSCAALAEDKATLRMDAARLPDLARLAFGEIEGRPFAFSPEFDECDKRLTLHLWNVEKTTLVLAIRRGIENAGFQAEQKGGVIWIEPREKASELVEVYSPQFRSASYILDAVAAFFPAGTFGSQRGVANAMPAVAPAASLAASPNGNHGKPGQPAPADTGSSAFSVTDKRPELIVFQGRAADWARFQKLAAEIDSRPAEIVVKAVVYEVGNAQSEGGALALALKVAGGKLGINLGNAGSAGGWSAVLHGAGLDVVFNALGQDSRFKVVSSPRLRVMSGQSARLVVGSDTPVLGAANLDKNGNPVQSVEYKSSGVIFSLTPQLRGGMSELAITQQISNFVPTTTGVNGSPTLIKRELATAVGVTDDDVLVLGGLEEAKDSGVDSGPTWLPGWLRGSSADKSNSEILLILQAQRI